MVKAKRSAQRANAVPSAMRPNHSVPIVKGGKSAASIRLPPRPALSLRHPRTQENKVGFQYLKSNSHIIGRQPHATRCRHGLLAQLAYSRSRKKSHSRTNMYCTLHSHSRLSISPHAGQTAEKLISPLQIITMNVGWPSLLQR